MIADQQATLFAADGVRISASHFAASDNNATRAFVVVHGFTGGWRQERVQKVVIRLREFGGVVALDMRNSFDHTANFPENLSRGSTGLAESG